MIGVPYNLVQPSRLHQVTATLGVYAPRGQDPCPVPDPSFGHWFAGFADGEGCFIIARGGRNNTSFCCAFIIGLRVDDLAVVETLREVTGVGAVHVYGPYASSQRAGAKPQARWDVGNRADCLKLRDIFDRYPLRSKKAGDFAIWREAVQCWAEQDWARMSELHDAIRENRRYDGEAVELRRPETHARLFEVGA